MTREEWRPVPGWEGLYEASSLGRVRSLDRIIKRSIDRKPRLHRGRILRPMWTTKGRPENRYGAVRLMHQGRHEVQRLGPLICTVFNGPRPDGLICRHLDGDPTNNAASNLAWGTLSENTLDSVAHGTHPWARRTHCARGHEYTPENIYPARRGRRCRACTLAKSAAWRAKNRDYQPPSHRKPTRQAA